MTEEENIRKFKEQESWEKVKQDMLAVISANAESESFGPAIGLTSEDYDNLYSGKQIRVELEKTSTMGEVYGKLLELSNSPAEFIFYSRIVGVIEGMLE